MSSIDFASSSQKRDPRVARCELETFRSAARRFLEAVGDAQVQCNKPAPAGPPEHVTWPQQAAPKEWKERLMGETIPKRKEQLKSALSYFHAQPANTVPWACGRDRVRVAAEHLKFSNIRLQTLLKFAELNTLKNPKQQAAWPVVQWGLQQLPSITGELSGLIQNAEAAIGEKIRHIGIRPTNKEDLKYGKTKAEQVKDAIESVFKADPEALKKELDFLNQEKQLGAAAVEPPTEQPVTAPQAEAPPQEQPQAQPQTAPEQPAPESPIELVYPQGASPEVQAATWQVLGLSPQHAAQLQGVQDIPQSALQQPELPVVPEPAAPPVEAPPAEPPVQAAPEPQLASETPELDKASKLISFEPAPVPGVAPEVIAKIRNATILAAQAAHGDIPWAELPSFTHPLIAQIKQQPWGAGLNHHDIDTVIHDTLTEINKAWHNISSDAVNLFTQSAAELGQLTPAAVKQKILDDHGVILTAMAVNNIIKLASKAAPPAPAAAQVTATPVTPASPPTGSILPPDAKVVEPVPVAPPPPAPPPFNEAQKAQLAALIKQEIKIKGIPPSNLAEIITQKASALPDFGEIDQNALNLLIAHTKQEITVNPSNLQPTELAEIEKLGKQELTYPELGLISTTEGFQAKIMKAKGFWLSKKQAVELFSKISALGPDPVSYESLPPAKKEAVGNYAKTKAIEKAFVLSSPDGIVAKNGVKMFIKQKLIELNSVVHAQDIDDLAEATLDKYVNLGLDELSPTQASLIQGVASNAVSTYGAATTYGEMVKALKLASIVHLNAAAVASLLQKTLETDLKPDIPGFLAEAAQWLAKVPKSVEITPTAEGAKVAIGHTDTSMSVLYAKHQILYANAGAQVDPELAKLAETEASKRLDQNKAAAIIRDAYDKFWQQGNKINKQAYVSHALGQHDQLAEAGFFAGTFGQVSGTGTSAKSFAIGVFDQWFDDFSKAEPNELPDAFKSLAVKTLLDNPQVPSHVIAELTGMTKDKAYACFHKTTWPVLTSTPPLQQTLAKAVALAGGAVPQTTTLSALAKFYSMSLPAMKAAAKQAVENKSYVTTLPLGGTNYAKPLLGGKAPPPVPAAILSVPPGGVVQSLDQLNPPQQAWLNWQVAALFGHTQPALPADWNWATDGKQIVDAFEQLPVHKAAQLTLNPNVLAAAFAQVAPTLPPGPTIAGSILKPSEQVIGLSTAQMEHFANLELPPAGPKPPAGPLGPIHVGGSKPKFGVEDATSGLTWMFKPDPPSESRVMSLSEVAGGRVQELLGFPVPIVLATHVTTVKGDSGSKFGSIQCYMPNQTFGRGQKQIWTKAINAPVVKDIQRNQILFWLTSNHDGHGENMVVMHNTPAGKEHFKGRVVPIDNGQCGKFILEDELDIDYNPNEKFELKGAEASQMLKAWVSGESVPLTPLNDPEILDIFDRAESVPAHVWRKIWEPYATESAKLSKTKAKTNADKLLDAFEKRRLGARADFAKFYRGLVDRRVQHMAEEAGEGFDADAAREKLINQLGIPQFEALISAPELGPIAKAKIVPPKEQPAPPPKPKTVENDLYLMMAPEDQAARFENGVPRLDAIKRAASHGIDMLTSHGDVRDGRVKFWMLGDRPFFEFQLGFGAASRLDAKMPGHATSGATNVTSKQQQLLNSVEALNLEVMDVNLQKHLNIWLAGHPSGIKSPGGAKNAKYSKLKYFHAALMKAHSMATSADPLKKMVGEHYLKQFEKIGKKPMGTPNSLLAAGDKVPLAAGNYELDDTLAPTDRQIETFATPQNLLDNIAAEEAQAFKASVDKLPDCDTGAVPCAERRDYTAVPAAVSKSIFGEASRESLDTGQEMTTQHLVMKVGKSKSGSNILDAQGGVSYRVKLGDGVVVNYIPRFNGKGSPDIQPFPSRCGQVRVEFEPGTTVSDQHIANAMEKLKALGIEVQGASRDDAELEYLRQMAWLRKLHGVPVGSGALGNKIQMPAGLTKKQQIEVYVQALKDHTGHDPRYLPGTTKPNPSYQPVPFNSGGRFGFRRFDVSDEDIAKWKQDGYYLYHDVKGSLPAPAAYSMLLGGSFMSYDHRSQRGIPFGGWSSGSDVHSGGSKEAFLRIGKGFKPGGKLPSKGSSNRLLFSPELLAFTHVYSQDNDVYGSKKPEVIPKRAGTIEEQQGDLIEALSYANADDNTYDNANETVVADIVDLDRFLIGAKIQDETTMGGFSLVDTKTGAKIDVPQVSRTREELIDGLLTRLRDEGKQLYGGIRVFDDNWEPTKGPDGLSILSSIIRGV